MKIDNRVMSLLALTSGAAAATSLINRYIRFSAVSKTFDRASPSLL